MTFPANDLAQITSVKARTGARQSATSDDSIDALAQQLVYQAAVMILESKDASIRHQVGDTELAAQTQEWQARVQAELCAMYERYDLERKARARGERVPSLHSDPEAYVSWLQRQRALPYIELARDLDRQSRRGS